MPPASNDWMETIAPGGSGTRLRSIWRTMRNRCGNPKVEAYEYYGARGIAVSPQWDTFVGFLDWALAAGYADDKEIDRIDSDGPYSPSNCRWVSPFVNRARGELDRAGAYLDQLGGRLTEAQVSAAAPREKPYRLPDGHGLHLMVMPTGSKGWRYRYRVDDKEKTLAIGPYPRIGLQEAREVHAISRQRVGRGLDPAKMKRAAKARQRKSRSTA